MIVYIINHVRGNDMATTVTTVSFSEALEAYGEAIVQKTKEHYERHGYNWRLPTIEFMRGRRYIRVVKWDDHGRNIHSFVDTTTGDILKPASWKAPAKHPRGNIFDLQNAHFNHFGPAYLR